MNKQINIFSGIFFSLSFSASCYLPNKSKCLVYFVADFCKSGDDLVGALTLTSGVRLGERKFRQFCFQRLMEMSYTENGRLMSSLRETHIVGVVSVTHMFCEKAVRFGVGSLRTPGNLLSTWAVFYVVEWFFLTGLWQFEDWLLFLIGYWRTVSKSVRVTVTIHVRSAVHFRWKSSSETAENDSWMGWIMTDGRGQGR